MMDTKGSIDDKNLLNAAHISSSVDPQEAGVPIVWMKHSTVNLYIYIVLSVLSGGLLHVFCTVHPKWKDWCLASPCDAPDADSAVVTVDGVKNVVKVQHNDVDGKKIISVEAVCKRYWASATDGWILRPVDDVPAHFSDLVQEAPTSTEKISRKMYFALYGLNVMELPKASFWDILAVTIFHPFYIFQYFAVIVWMFEDYILYACVILLITGGAIYLTTSETVFNLRRLHDLAGISSTVSVILPSGEIVEVSDKELVPGDRFIIKQGTAMPCDAVLVSGRVSVDESMLTGESVPVNKTPVVESVFSTRNPDGSPMSNQAALGRYPGHVLFSGTKVLLTSSRGSGTEGSSEQCVAVVYRTGFRSAKGQLIATLLNPKENFLSFFSDALWVILFMAVLCTVLYIWSAVYLRKNNATWGDICLKYLDAITIAVPPALTASLTVATGISIDRLRKKNIFVSESTRVNWAGIIGAVCFDKTGTLTEERLHFKGVSVPEHIAAAANTSVTSPDSCFSAQKAVSSVELSPDSENIPLPCMELMATCHALAVINGTPLGDPLEVELFRASGYSLQTPSTGEGEHSLSAHPPGPPTSSNGYKILRHFEFTSDRLRAGSLVQRPEGTCVYYCKGSPEIIINLVRQETVPPDIHTTLNSLSKRGLRVLALCYKLVANPLPGGVDALSAPQSALEEDMVFLGLVFLSNALKAETVSTISALRKADIKCNMITGDHIYTAIAIATDCGLLVPGQDVNIIDAEESSPSGIAITSTRTEGVVSTNLFDFMTHIDRPTDSQNSTSTQIAVTGRGLEVVKTRHAYVLKILLECTQVFARMKPSDKQYIVDELQRMTEKEVHQHVHDSSMDAGDNNVQISSDKTSTHGLLGASGTTIIDNVSTAVNMSDDGRGNLHVLFCGDGANDMAALRAATVGVSLCEAETSVAAPITSRLQTPGSVVDVIKEGRCSLITAYVLVAFNIMYGTIQLFMAVMMYNYGLEVGDNTYLIQDLFYTLVLGLVIAVTPPSAELSEELPPQRFFTKYFCFKLFSQIICFPIFQLIGLRALAAQSWYHKYDFGDDPLTETYAYETSVIASLGLAQVMIASVVATIDEPFRKMWYTNKYHTTALLFQSGFLAYQIFGRKSKFMEDVLEIRPLHLDFCWILVAIIALNCAVSGFLSWCADLIKKHLS